MFRITRLTDYGVLLMTQIAKDTACVHNAADLAEQVRVPLPTVSKILQILLRENLLESVRGAGGGYRLARTASDISVRDIIVALEGPIALTECNLEEGSCEQEPHCATRGNWQIINQAVRHALGDISLADMIQPAFAPVMRVETHHGESIGQDVFKRTGAENG